MEVSEIYQIREEKNNILDQIGNWKNEIVNVKTQINKLTEDNKFLVTKIVNLSNHAKKLDKIKEKMNSFPKADERLKRKLIKEIEIFLTRKAVNDISSKIMLAKEELNKLKTENPENKKQTILRLAELNDELNNKISTKQSSIINLIRSRSEEAPGFLFPDLTEELIHQQNILLEKTNINKDKLKQAIKTEISINNKLTEEIQKLQNLDIQRFDVKIETEMEVKFLETWIENFIISNDLDSNIVNLNTISLEGAEKLISEKNKIQLKELELLDEETKNTKKEIGLREDTINELDAQLRDLKLSKNENNKSTINNGIYENNKIENPIINKKRERESFFNRVGANKFNKKGIKLAVEKVTSLVNNVRL